MIFQRCTCCLGLGEIRNGGNGPIIECPVCGGTGNEEVAERDDL